MTNENGPSPLTDSAGVTERRRCLVCDGPVEVCAQEYRRQREVAKVATTLPLTKEYLADQRCIRCSHALDDHDAGECWAVDDDGTQCWCWWLTLAGERL